MGENVYHMDAGVCVCVLQDGSFIFCLQKESFEGRFVENKLWWVHLQVKYTI